MVFFVGQDVNPEVPDEPPRTCLLRWWCNFVSGIMMPKFLPAVKWAARSLSRG
jgi:hypothetical protein